MQKLSSATNIIKKLCVYWDDYVNIEDKNHPLITTINEYKSVNPDYEISLISKLEVKEFLKNNFKFLYEMFDRFNIYSVRSNIARIVHLYLHGGFYCDTHVKILNSLNLVQICEKTNEFNLSSTSFISTNSKDCNSIKPNLGLLYSSGNDVLYLECLRIIENKTKEIVDKNKYKAGMYAHDIHVASGNGFYVYINKEGKTSDPAIDKGVLFNYFRHILPYGGDPKIAVCYGSKVMTSGLTRAGNKHWSVLCKELDLFY